MRQSLRSLWCALAVGCAAVASGCRSAPDVGPFVEATSALDVVVASLGTQLEGQLQDPVLAEQFRRTWQPRTAAMQAIADYASGLAQVVEAGRTGEQAAAAVLGEAKELLRVVGVAFPAADAATELVAKAVVKAHGLFAADRAAESVAQAIEQASPAVDELATALAEDMLALEKLVAVGYTGARTRIEGEYAMMEKGGPRLLQSLRDAAADKRTAAARATKSADREVLIAEAAQFETLVRQETGTAWYSTMTAELEGARREAAARREAIRAAAATTIAWKAAHADLARAARTGMTPNYVVLVQLTRDLLSAYAEAKKP